MDHYGLTTAPIIGNPADVDNHRGEWGSKDLTTEDSEPPESEYLSRWTEKVASLCVGPSGDRTPHLLIRGQRCNRLRHKCEYEGLKYAAQSY
jgi:hypothetical protein